MKSACLKCAKLQRVKGYNICLECFEAIWPVLVHNLSTDAELTDEQEAKLSSIAQEMARVVGGMKETGLDPVEFAEYLVGKARERTEAQEGTGCSKP